MAFYPPPGSQPHSVYSPLPPVTAYPTSSYYPPRRRRHHSTSSFSSYPLVPHGNAYGLNSYPPIPHWYGQGYSGVPTTTSASHNGQVPFPIPQQPQQPQPVHQTQRLPYFGNPYIPPSSTVIHAPGRTMGQGITPHYNYQGNQSYYPMQGNQVGQPQAIVVKLDGGGRRRRRHHHRRRSSSY